MLGILCILDLKFWTIPIWYPGPSQNCPKVQRKNCCELLKSEDLRLLHEVKTLLSSAVNSPLICLCWFQGSTYPKNLSHLVYVESSQILGRNISGWLVGGIPTPLKNMSSSVGMILPNIWKVIKFMFQTTNQIWKSITSSKHEAVLTKSGGFHRSTWAVLCSCTCGRSCCAEGSWEHKLRGSLVRPLGI